MLNTELEYIINQKLNSKAIKDYAPNGLQVEGCQDVQRIITGVTACQALLDNAITYNADAVIVHHGYFWKNEAPIISGIRRNRLKTLLANDINLYAWHLPLDIHQELGNNAQFALALNIQVTAALEPLLLEGKLIPPLSGDVFCQRLRQVFGHCMLYFGDGGPAQISRLAWCTGAGQRFIELAAQAGVDAFITGEVSEQTIHVAREQSLHFYAIGHHATERGGIRALGAWLTKQYDLDVTFIDIPNPA